MNKALWVITGLGVVVILTGIGLWIGRGYGTEPAVPKEWIAVGANRTGHWDVWLVSTDGREEINLTNGRGNSDHPRFSPDGRKIVFVSDRHGTYGIYTMAVDGSFVRRLSDGFAKDVRPVFSPDGSKIAFQSNRDGTWQIYVMSADGSGERKLTNGPGGNYAPYFSPDGRTVVFVSDRDGNYEIYSMKADGSEQQRLTNNPAKDGNPKISPDGTKIVFESSRAAPAGRDTGQVYIINMDGSGVEAITQGRARPDCGFSHSDNNRPSFSPDGQSIVFQSHDSSTCGLEVFVMDASGENRRQVTNWRITGDKLDMPVFSPVPLLIQKRR